jgi:hypothetical protein
MGPANPLYRERTGYKATMVGIPYDDVKGWCSQYPPDVWANQMARVRDGFDRGCELFGKALDLMPAAMRPAAEKELRMFRGEALHFRSCVDQVVLYQCREAGDSAGLRRQVAKELASAKELLDLAQRDSRFGYESSNQYFYIPQDLREKIVACRLFLERSEEKGDRGRP